MYVSHSLGCLWKDGPVVLDGAVGGQCITKSLQGEGQALGSDLGLQTAGQRRPVCLAAVFFVVI